MWDMFRRSRAAGRGCGRCARHFVDKDFLLNETFVEVLGGSVINSLHESFEKYAFIRVGMCRSVKLSEDSVNGFKE
jgi:hypothetical protein